MPLTTGATPDLGRRMLVRIIHFIAGAVLAGGGGFLGWTERARAASLFPPDAAGAPWLLIAGVLGVAAGLVFLVSAVLPRADRSARVAAEAARREETLNAADAFYAERARAADRDWRSGELPPAPRPAPEPAPMPPLDLTLPAPARPSAVKPVATSAPPEATPFPSTATLAPIPRSSDPPPRPAPALAPVAAPTIAPTTAPTTPTAPPAPAATPFAAIRAALAAGRLEEADKLLTVEREKAEGEALAELTGLAGDHAAAAGRASNAKWLWRLALKRFGELNAMDSPAARAVSERLRLAD
jgi:hypothetical protein